MSNSSSDFENKINGFKYGFLKVYPPEHSRKGC